MLTFKEIISEENISFEELTTSNKYLDFSTRKEKEKMSPEKRAAKEAEENPPITPEQQKKNLAFVARMIANGHGGYPEFEDHEKKAFEYSIARLYNNADKTTDTKSFLKNVSKATKNLPDNHLKISDGNNLLFSEWEAGNVGQNFEQEKQWSINTSSDGIGIIALPKIGNGNPNDWIKFSETLQKERFNSDGTERWSSIVIDMRGNPGGADLPMEYLARTLYGNEVAFGEKMAYRDTKENDFLRYNGKEITKEEYQDRLQNHEYTGEYVTSHDFSNHKEEFPAFVNGGYKKPINILLDREVASAAETFCPMMRNHPGVTFIGENTSGTKSERSAASVVAECGYGLKVGSQHIYFEEGKMERTGFTPDIITKNEQVSDALVHYVQNRNKIDGAAMERIEAYKQPDITNKPELVANPTDMAIVRGMRNGYPEKAAKKFYLTMNPEKGKEEKWDKIVNYTKTGKFELPKTENSNSANEKLSELRGTGEKKATEPVKKQEANANVLAVAKSKEATK